VAHRRPGAVRKPPAGEHRQAMPRQRRRSFPRQPRLQPRPIRRHVLSSHIGHHVDLRAGHHVRLAEDRHGRLNVRPNAIHRDLPEAGRFGRSRWQRCRRAGTLPARRWSLVSSSSCSPCVV
jgi:hypothetical protein